jgi:hypothetical protein
MLRLDSKLHYFQKYYWLILIVALVATTLGAYWSFKLRVDSDLAKLLPQDYQSVKTLEHIKETVGGQGSIRIVLESHNFEKMKVFADDLAARLSKHPDVNYVDYKHDMAFFKKSALLLLELDELDSLRTAIRDKINYEKQKLNPLFVEDLFGDEEETSDVELTKWEEKYKSKEPKEYYINADSTIMVVDVYPSGANTSLDFVEKLVNEVTQTVDGLGPKKYDPEMKILYGGSFKNRLDEYQVIINDVLKTAYYGFIGIFVLLLIYFRHLLSAILVTITLLMSLAWTFGVTYWVLGNLNTITGFLIVILFGLGVEYGIHALSRYSESRRAGLTVDESLLILVGPTTRAMTTSSLTSVGGFYTLMLLDFKGFSDMGFISGTGLLFALMAMVIVLPALIILLEKLHLFKLKPAKQNSKPLRARTFPFVRPILLTALLVTVFSLYGISQVQFEYDFTNLRVELPERQEVGQKTQGVFELSESPAIVLGNSKQEVNEIVKAVKAIIKKDTASPTVKTVRSAYSFVPDDQPEKLAIIADIRTMIEEETEGILKGADKERIEKLQEYLQVREPFTLADLPENLRRQFTDQRGQIGNFAFIYASVPLRDGKNAIEFRNDIGKITTASQKVFYPSSPNIIFADMLLITIREGRIAALLSFVVLSFIVFLDFRKLKETLLILTPLTLGLIWMGGAMFVLGLKLNFFNIVALPSIIGIGEDSGVHYYHRYKEEGRGSLLHVLRHTGLAISMCAFTTLVGYSGLITARHPGLNSLGDLALIGIITTYLAAILVLSAVLQFLENRRVPAATPVAVPEIEQS